MIRAVLFATVIALSAAVTTHPETVKGTIVSATPAKLSVSVIDDKTKKPGLMVFDLDKDTKILRGDTVVTFDESKMSKGEPVSVRFNDDDGGSFADVIWLNSRK